jgi:xylan 1,4-beta-xylosidase
VTRPTTKGTRAGQARWEERSQGRTGYFDVRLDLPAPANLRATPGVGHVRLSWDPVTGAAGYVVQQTGPNGKTAIVEHGGSDVAAVPGTEFACTGLEDGAEYSFRVAAVTGAGQPPGKWSARESCSVRRGDPGPVKVGVDASVVTGQTRRVWAMVGSERLSQLLLEVDEHGHDIGAEFLEALRIAHDDLGARWVRAHAILHDDLSVVHRDDTGRLAFDFSKVDRVYDRLLEIGLRPVVELSFMPAALASDPKKTVFTYQAIVSPPSNWDDWYNLVRALAWHLVERYGLEEVAKWPFEVWNEPNLSIFWSGTLEQYLRLYDESAHALKSVDGALQVGGPSSAAGEWVEALVTHAKGTGAPLDFVSTHTYGNQPLDLRPTLARHGYEGLPVYWTEWGVGSTHFGPVHDSVLGAPFLLEGYNTAQDRVDSLSHWVVSDHFEELGRPPRLFHDGFGLLTVGNLRKPRYWAAHLAAHQGNERLSGQLSGDGAGVLVGASPTRHANGSLDLLLWNGTVNAALMAGDARLDRRVIVYFSGLSAPRYRATLARVDRNHSNIVTQLPSDIAWPDPATWSRLRAADVLDEETLGDIVPDRRSSRIELFLPMPGVARLRLTTA